MSDEAKPANPIEVALTALRFQREQLDKAIQILETLGTGIPLPSFTVPIGGAPAPTILGSAGLSNGGEIASGSFHGMSIEAAVKKLLAMRRKTMTAQELAQDLRAGGLHLQSETPANTIASVLSRAFNAGGSDIVRVSRGQWGLQEWYPTQRFKRGED